MDLNLCKHLQQWLECSYKYRQGYLQPLCW